MTHNSTLPAEYHILPESIDFYVPGFEKMRHPYSKTLVLKKRDCAEWYGEFVTKLADSVGNRFLPVCRMSDGEFMFILGERPLDKRLPLTRRLRHEIYRLRSGFAKKKDFEASTSGHYHSGRYSREERRKMLSGYAEMLREISLKGILALHLSYGTVPFQERFFPAFSRWLQKNSIVLTDLNYYPFYFAYAALTGERRREILENRRILVVHGEKGEKRKMIEKGLAREGVADVLWCKISLKRSLYDKPDFAKFVGKADIAVVGAGIGKPNILTRMEPLGIPCVDAGFVFEVWADKNNGRSRPFCMPDNE